MSDRFHDALPELDESPSWLEVELLWEPPLPPDQDHPEGEPWRGARVPPAQPDPDLGHGFTAVLALTPIAFGLVIFAILYAPAYWGPLGAGLLGGLFCAMYVAVFWVGSKWFESYRR